MFLFYLFLRFVGSAGQSFGCFLTPGMNVRLIGEANDYVGKVRGSVILALNASYLPSVVFYNHSFMVVSASNMLCMLRVWLEANS